MDIASLIDFLLAAGRRGDFASIITLPEAGNHRQACALASALRGPLLDRVASMAVSDRAAFTKALAVYEDTVGGLGSVTALEPVLGLFQNDAQEGRNVHFWILEHTSSNRYYVQRAANSIDPEAANRRWQEARYENERRNYELAAPARARRAERASSNLYNAVRRGDIAAVRALLQKGASSDTTAPDGTPLVRYAEVIGREDIAELIRTFSSSGSPLQAHDLSDSSIHAGN